MSSRVGSEVNHDEILNYLDKLKHERRITEQNITSLEKERNLLDGQIKELERRRNEVDSRCQREKEIGIKQDQSIHQAETAYKKILESSKSLADFVRREYQESRRE